MANGDEFLIPFGADASDFFKEIKDIQDSLQDISKTADTASKGMSDSFGRAADAAEGLENAVKNDEKALKLLANLASGVGDQLKKALDGKAVGNGLEERFKKFNTLLNDLTKKAQSPISFNIDEAKLKTLEKMLDDGADSFKVFEQAVALAKEELNRLDPNTEEFKQLSQVINVSEEAIKELNEQLGDLSKRNTDVGATFEEVYGDLQPLQTRLGEVEDRLHELALAGQQNTDEFKQLMAEAVRYRQTIQQVDASVEAFTKTGAGLAAVVEGATALTGAFAAVQGASALFGEESEEINEVLLKVNAAMAILEGLQAALAVLNKDSAISALLLSGAQTAQATSAGAAAAATTAEAAATTTATAATNAFTAALLANPITAIAVALAAAAAAMIYFATKTDDAEESAEALNKQLERQNELLSLDNAGVTRRANEQIAAIRLLGLERAKGAKNELELLKIQQDTERRVSDAQRSALDDRLKNQRRVLLETQHLYDQENADREKLGAELIKQEQAIKDTQSEILVARFEAQARNVEDEEALQKKRQDLAKAALEKEKENAEKRKAIADQESKFLKALRDAETAALEKDFDKRRAEAQNAVDDQIDSLNSEKALTQKAIDTRNKTIIQLRQNLKVQLEAIDKEELQNRLSLELEANTLIASLKKDGYDKQLQELKLSFDQQRRDIIEKYKDQADLQNQLLTAINTAEAQQTKKLTQEITIDRIQEETERQQLLVETAAKYIGASEEVEREKQLAILNVQLDGAKKRLEALISSGEAETSTVVLQAKKQVQELEKQVEAQGKEVAKGKGVFDLQKLLFGDLGAAGNAAVKDALSTIGKSFEQVTDFINEQYQRQIDKRQEIIDQYEEDISTLEDKLNKEKSLRDQGVANNVAALEQEIAAKKAAREEELKQQQEIIEKQKGAAKVQFGIDTALQASNLITAATKIFNSFAGIPFGLGIPLAIATVALMTGAFVAGRIKMYQAINDGQKQSFGGGGWVEGESHSRGGKKYVSNDNRGDVIELEGDEFVMNKRQAAKFGGILEAMNNDDLSSINDYELGKLLSSFGISMPVEDAVEALNISRERDGLKISMSGGADLSADTERIRNATELMARKMADQSERWSDGQYNYVKKGNKTTKTPIK